MLGLGREETGKNGNIILIFLGKQKKIEKQNNAWYYEMTPCASGGAVVH